MVKYLGLIGRYRDMPQKDAENDVPSPLKKNLDWYIANQRDLSAKYSGKILLIVDQKLVDVFDSMGNAYITAMKSYAPGTFTLLVFDWSTS